MSFDHAGRAGFVTGGGSGIGRATAIRLASEGSAVAVVDVDLAAAEATAKTISEEGGSAAAFEADVRDRTQVEAARDGALAAFGRLRYLVNNAGLVRMSPFDELAEEEWDL